MSTHRYAFEVGPQAPCFEFVTYAAPDAIGDALPVRPGQVLCDDAARPTLLHFAPRRWLVPAPDATLVARLTGLAAGGLGALVDVDGKWCKVLVDGSGAARAIASTINVEGVLRNRGCAAVSLFDAPAILARVEAAVDLWVAASYLDHFVDVTRTLRLPT